MRRRLRGLGRGFGQRLQTQTAGQTVQGIRQHLLNGNTCTGSGFFVESGGGAVQRNSVAYQIIAPKNISIYLMPGGLTDVIE